MKRNERPRGIDLHGGHFADALPKLEGLVRFAEEYGDQFLRIEAISKVEDELKMLDLKQVEVREAIQAATSAGALYRGELAEKY